MDQIFVWSISAVGYNNSNGNTQLARSGLQATKNPLFIAGFCTSLDYLGYVLGGAERDRTAGLLNAIQALSQLSYSPNKT